MQAYYQTYNSEDPEALARFYAPDVVFESAQGITHGVEPILESYRYLIGLFHDQMTADVIEISEDTAVVAITDRFEAKQVVADFFGQSFAVGDTLVLQLRGIYQMRGGQFCHIRISLQD